MIRIIKGTYGFVGNDGVVSPKTPKDEPFTTKAEEEARLVALGVAEYVDVQEESEIAAEEPEKAEAAKEEKKPATAKKKSTAKKKTAKVEETEEEPPQVEAADPE